MLNSVAKKVSSLFSKKNDQEKIAPEKSAPFSDGITLDDFARQLNMLDKVGSLSKIARFVPGMKGLKISPQQLEQGKQEAALFKKIIAAMSPVERKDHRVLTTSRKRQIAAGAGVREADVTLLLSRFEQMQQFAKLMKRSG